MSKDRSNPPGQLLQLAQLGHVILRKKATHIKNVKDSQLKKLISDLKATVMDVDGVGISASQVYKPIRLFVIASHPNPRYPKAPYMKPTAVINPYILNYSKQKTKDWEGCLSVPGIRGLVPRHKRITVSYRTEKGTVVKKQYKDFIARIFQHEYDHLEGLLFIDRVESTKEMISEKEYQKLIKNKK